MNAVQQLAHSNHVITKPGFPAYREFRGHYFITVVFPRIKRNPSDSLQRDNSVYAEEDGSKPILNASCQHREPVIRPLLQTLNPTLTIIGFPLRMAGEGKKMLNIGIFWGIHSLTPRKCHFSP